MLDYKEKLPMSSIIYHSSSNSSTEAWPPPRLSIRVNPVDPLIPSTIGRPILMRESEFFDN